jgi:dihydrodipicolinate synthase/N-acetylneuraminate lyase
VAAAAQPTLTPEQRLEVLAVLVAAVKEEIVVVLLAVLEQQTQVVVAVAARTLLAALHLTAEMVDQVLLSLGTHQTEPLPQLLD